MSKRISVVIPVFNVENYLNKCLKSVLSQSYCNLEIILVDDGSTDASGEICDKYAKADPRVKVIHQENGGAARAKNAGLRAATGDYLAIVDSDDFLAKDAYFKLVKALEEHEADVVEGGFSSFTIHSASDTVFEHESLSGEAYLQLFTKQWTCGLLWNKLYKRQLFQDVFFEEGHIIDDEYFTYQGIIKAEKVVRISDVVYCYRQRKSSVMRSQTSKERIVFDKLDYLQKRLDCIRKKKPQLSAEFEDHYLNMLLILSRDENLTHESLKQIKNQVKRFLSEGYTVKIPHRFRLQLLILEFAPSWYLMRKKKQMDASLDDKAEYYS